MERDKEQTRLYEDILKYIEYKKANGVKYADAIEEVNDRVKYVVWIEGALIGSFFILQKGEKYDYKRNILF